MWGDFFFLSISLYCSTEEFLNLTNKKCNRFNQRLFPFPLLAALTLVLTARQRFLLINLIRFIL